MEGAKCPLEYELLSREQIDTLLNEGLEDLAAERIMSSRQVRAMRAYNRLQEQAASIDYMDATGQKYLIENITVFLHDRGFTI